MQFGFNECLCAATWIVWIQRLDLEWQEEKIYMYKFNKVEFLSRFSRLWHFAFCAHAFLFGFWWFWFIYVRAECMFALTLNDGATSHCTHTLSITMRTRALIKLNILEKLKREKKKLRMQPGLALQRMQPSKRPISQLGSIKIVICLKWFILIGANNVTYFSKEKKNNHNF